MSESRRASEAQVEAARDAMRQFYDGSPDAPRGVADAVVAAGDADEVTRLRAEVKEWKRADSASCDLAARYRQRAMAAEAERDVLRETVARVEALADEPGWPSDTIRAIRAALSGPSNREEGDHGD